MGTAIFNHQTIAFMLADMATGIEASRLLTYKSAYEIDAGRSNTMFASMAKVNTYSFKKKRRKKSYFSARATVGDVAVEMCYRGLNVREMLAVLSGCGRRQWRRASRTPASTPVLRCAACAAVLTANATRNASWFVA